MALWVNHEADGTQHQDLPSLDLGDITVSKPFRDSERRGGIRLSHAVEVLGDPTALVKFDLKDSSILLATRKVSIGRRPHVALVIATLDAKAHLTIWQAFKLFSDNDGLAQLEAAPGEAFRRVLVDFGVPVHVGNQVGLFVPYAIVSRYDNLVHVTLKDLPKRGTMVAVVELLENTPGYLLVQWAFSIDLRSTKSPSGRKADVVPFAVGCGGHLGSEAATASPSGVAD